jgi:hypothetical protein
MAMAFDPRIALPHAQFVSADLRTDSFPVDLAAFEQNQTQIMQEPRQTVANLALTQGWSFAGVAADTASPESASSGTISANPQQPVAEVSVSDGIERGASRAEAPPQDLTPTGLLVRYLSKGEHIANYPQKHRQSPSRPRSPQGRLRRSRALRPPSQPSKRVRMVRTTFAQSSADAGARAHTNYRLRPTKHSLPKSELW